VERNAGSGRKRSGVRRSNVPVRTLIDRIDLKIEKLQGEREVLRQTGQNKCSHPAGEILEAEYANGNYFTSPPFRVCKLCGYAEEGWHCGYWKLREDSAVPSVTRHAAMEYVIGGVITQKELNKKRYGR
jgi:hypothetical protein